MKTKILVAIEIVLFLAIYFNTYAQSKLQGPIARKDTIQHVNIYTGIITDWALNIEAYVYDGFYLQTKGEKFIVKFPVHMGGLLRKSIKAGNTISVNGIEGKDTLGVKKINLVSIIIDGKTIQDDPPILAGTTTANEIINGSAKIREFQKNVDGKIKGYILDNKTILRLAPNISGELEKALVVGASISYSGVKSDLGSGEDAWASYTIIRCQTITINGKQYLTQ